MRVIILSIFAVVVLTDTAQARIFVDCDPETDPTEPPEPAKEPVGSHPLDPEGLLPPCRKGSHPLRQNGSTGINIRKRNPVELVDFYPLHSEGSRLPRPEGSHPPPTKDSRQSRQFNNFPPHKKGSSPPHPKGSHPKLYKGSHPPGLERSHPHLLEDSRQPRQFGGFPSYFDSGPPQQQGRLPQLRGPPQQQGGPPQQQGGPPQQHSGPPLKQGGPPQQQGGPPQQHGGPPQHQGGPPQQQGEPPQQQGGPPQHRGGPRRQQSGPPQQQGVPRRQQSGPLQQHGGPRRQQSGPPQPQSRPPRQLGRPYQPQSRPPKPQDRPPQPQDRPPQQKSTPPLQQWRPPLQQWRPSLQQWRPPLQQWRPPLQQWRPPLQLGPLRGKRAIDADDEQESTEASTFSITRDLGEAKLVRESIIFFPPDFLLFYSTDNALTEYGYTQSTTAYDFSLSDPVVVIAPLHAPVCFLVCTSLSSEQALEGLNEINNTISLTSNVVELDGTGEALSPEEAEEVLQANPKIRIICDHKVILATVPRDIDIPSPGPSDEIRFSTLDSVVNIRVPQIPR